MKIHHISDTHNHHDELTLPGGDVIVHSGDATNRGSLEEIMRFLEWYGNLPYKYKILVPGNHDWGFEHNEPLFRQECESRGIILLINEAVEIECVKFYGSPVQPWFFDWAFNVQRGPDIAAVWAMIPDDTEVLITHGPPAAILDYVPRGHQRVGCHDLITRILQTKVKLHLFGHIHYSRGTLSFMDRMYSNASTVDDHHRVMSKTPWRFIKAENGLYELELD